MGLLNFLTSVRNVRRSDNTTDLFHSFQVRTQTTMHAENLLVNDGSNGQAVEAISKCLPQTNVVSSLAWQYDNYYCV